MSKLSNRLKDYLGKHNILQIELVNRLNSSNTIDNIKYNRTRMCRLVNGTRELSIIDMLNICNCLNATLNEVFGIKVHYEL